MDGPPDRAGRHPAYLPLHRPRRPALVHRAHPHRPPVLPARAGSIRVAALVRGPRLRRDRSAAYGSRGPPPGARALRRAGALALAPPPLQSRHSAVAFAAAAAAATESSRCGRGLCSVSGRERASLRPAARRGDAAAFIRQPAIAGGAASAVIRGGGSGLSR
jgi:hypothetical protein